MARAQFDRNEVTDKSIEFFWQNGYSASSMKQIVKNTGLQPGSIYLAFGSKEALFHEALVSYAQKAIATIWKMLDTSPSVGKGIRTLFETFILESTKVNYCSCFLIKTQLELAAEVNKLPEFAAAKLSEIDVLLRSYLEKEFDETVSRQRAGSIMLHIFGMRVYGYQQDSAETILEGLKQGFPWLPWE